MHLNLEGMKIAHKDILVFLHFIEYIKTELMVRKFLNTYFIWLLIMIFSYLPSRLP